MWDTHRQRKQKRLLPAAIKSPARYHILRLWNRESLAETNHAWIDTPVFDSIRHKTMGRHRKMVKREAARTAVRLTSARRAGTEAREIGGLREATTQTTPRPDDAMPETYVNRVSTEIIAGACIAG